MVVALVAILAASGTVAYKKVAQRAESVASLGKIKKIGNALAAYVATEGTWPQEPDGDNISSTQLWEWWFREMKEKQGIQTEEWFSAAHLRQVNRMRKAEGHDKLSERDYGKADDLKIPTFVPTKFDYGPYEPFRYPTQPWVVEGGEYRPDGMLMFMPNGSVHKVMSLTTMNALRSRR